MCESQILLALRLTWIRSRRDGLDQDTFDMEICVSLPGPRDLHAFRGSQNKEDRRGQSPQALLYKTIQKPPHKDVRQSPLCPFEPREIKIGSGPRLVAFFHVPQGPRQTRPSHVAEPDIGRALGIQAPAASQLPRGRDTRAAWPA